MSEDIRIPNGWECVELGEICDILMGQSPNGFSINQSFIGMPFLQSNADFKDKFPLEKNWTYRPTKIAKKYSILLSVRAPVGEINIADKNYCIGRGLASIQSKNHSILFLFFAIKCHNYKLKQLSQGSTFEAINRNNIEKIQIKFPKSKQEQQKIAQILNEIDNAILKTKELLEKNKRLKTALMQDLLSYGIDENENIRNPKTHKFKQSKLGFIPKEWECVELGEICDIRDGTHQTPKYITDGIPFYSVENITNNEFKNVKFISEKEHKKLTKKYKIETGDVLMTRIGSIGDCKYIDWNVNASFYVSLALLKFYKKEHGKYFVQTSKSNIFQNEIDLHSLPNAIPKKINLGSISSIKILIPNSKTEQQKISQILSSQDEKIQALKNKLTKLKSLKASLMQDLLSGKVRVTKLME